MSWLHHLFLALGLVGGRPRRALGAVLVAAAVGVSGAAIYTTTYDSGGASRSDHCFSDPGACGYPDPSDGTVGVPPGTSLTPSGSITVTTNGETVNAKDVTGVISVAANNVTIKNTKVTAADSQTIAIKQESGYSGLHVEDTEVARGRADDFGSGGMTLTRVWMHYCGECVHYVDAITDSYIEVPKANLNPDHYEPYFNTGTINVQHSVLLNPHIQTAAAYGGVVGGGPCHTHTTIQDSLLAGGGFLIYTCGNGTDPSDSTATITDNRFARCTHGAPYDQGGGHYSCTGYPYTGDGTDGYMGTNDGDGYFPYGGSYGETSAVYCEQTTWTNNVWDDNDAAVSCQMAISNPVSIGTNALDASAGSIALTTTGAVPSGARIWVVVGAAFGGSESLSSVGDTVNTYAVDYSVVGVGGPECLVAIASADAASGLSSGATITATLSASLPDRSIIAFYSTGVTTGTSADYGAVANNQSSVSAWLTTAVTVTSGDILLSASKFENSSPASSTATGGNSLIANASSGGAGSGLVAVYRIGTGASVSGGGTWDGTCATNGIENIAVAYSAVAGIPDKAGSGIIGP